MERIIDRFDKYMIYRKLNDNSVTIQLELSVGLLGKSRKEGRDLSKKVVDSILYFYKDIERVWFLTGEGEMLKSDVRNVVNEPEQVYNCRDCKSKEKRIKELEKEIEGLRGENRAYMKMLNIPIQEENKKVS